MDTALRPFLCRKRASSKMLLLFNRMITVPYQRGTTTATDLDTRLDLDHLQDRANTEAQWKRPASLQAVECWLRGQDLNL